MKNNIATIWFFLNEKNIFDDQIRWKYLKYEMRKFYVAEAKNEYLRK